MRKAHGRHRVLKSARAVWPCPNDEERVRWWGGDEDGPLPSHRRQDANAARIFPEASLDAVSGAHEGLPCHDSIRSLGQLGIAVGGIQRQDDADGPLRRFPTSRRVSVVRHVTTLAQ